MSAYYHIAVSFRVGYGSVLAMADVARFRRILDHQRAVWRRYGGKGAFHR